MTRKSVENIIRDYLADNLSIISSNLSLIQKEYYLPNRLGTRGFIDILAKDNKNNYVIIEIKRSNEASREALHEILKYVEALKQNKEVIESEIKVIIVSTEWKELIVPFSSFANRVNFYIQGILIEVNDVNYPTSVKEISPLKLKDERLFSPAHMIRLYKNKQNLQKGIESHTNTFRVKGIENFVLLILTPSENHQDLVFPEYSQTIQTLSSTLDIINYSIEPYMIYSAFVRLSKEEYLEQIRKHPDYYEELLSSLEEELSDNEIYSKYEDYLLDIKPYPYSDYVEISYPSKFRHKLLEDEGWKIEEIQRFGTLKDNELLKDSVILSEIAGKSGIDGAIFDCCSDSKDNAKIEEMKKGAKRVLCENKVWLNHIKLILEHHIESENKHSFDIALKIYSPNNILFSIYKQIKENNNYLWLPCYKLSLYFSDKKQKSYFGTIEWNGKKADIDNLINKYYQGKPSSLALPVFWGGYEENNSHIMEELGFSFGTILYELVEKDVMIKYDFNASNYCFVPTDTNRTPYDGINNFIFKNKDFVQRLIHHFESIPVV
ncbi:endonuclease NucS domain-containing protein [Calothrix sp. 336/3]|uniref:endonuclease NucS domain-containing protein n=1 Tax=Calothrix sp. 336/3 TaxID=1337936 RepID=UPI00069B69CE|nr:endonuclease NucS domain-containing protein [Calothrix sp. 336/3]